MQKIHFILTYIGFGFLLITLTYTSQDLLSFNELLVNNIVIISEKSYVFKNILVPVLDCIFLFFFIFVYIAPRLSIYLEMQSFFINNYLLINQNTKFTIQTHFVKIITNIGVSIVVLSLILFILKGKIGFFMFVLILLSGLRCLYLIKPGLVKAELVNKINTYFLLLILGSFFLIPLCIIIYIYDYEHINSYLYIFYFFRSNLVIFLFSYLLAYFIHMPMTKDNLLKFGVTIFTLLILGNMLNSLVILCNELKLFYLKIEMEENLKLDKEILPEKNIITEIKTKENFQWISKFDYKNYLLSGDSIKKFWIENFRVLIDLSNSKCNLYKYSSLSEFKDYDFKESLQFSDRDEIILTKHIGIRLQLEKFFFDTWMINFLDFYGKECRIKYNLKSRAAILNEISSINPQERMNNLRILRRYYDEDEFPDFGPSEFANPGSGLWDNTIRADNVASEERRAPQYLWEIERETKGPLMGDENNYFFVDFAKKSQVNETMKAVIMQIFVNLKPRSIDTHLGEFVTYNGYRRFFTHRNHFATHWSDITTFEQCPDYLLNSMERHTKALLQNYERVRLEQIVRKESTFIITKDMVAMSYIVDTLNKVKEKRI